MFEIVINKLILTPYLALIITTDYDYGNLTPAQFRWMHNLPNIHADKRMVLPQTE